MAAISALTEDCNGASAGTTVSTSNSIADALTGTGTAVFNADTFQTGLPSIEFTGSATLRYMRCDHTGALGWRGMALKVTSMPAANVAVMAWYNASTAGGDLRLNSAGTLSVRDSGFTSRYTTTAVLSTSTWYWVAVKVTNADHRLKLYNGSTGALIEDSGSLTNSGFNQTTLDSIRVGLVGSATATIRVARIRGDDASEPPTGITSGPSAVYTVSNRTLVDTTGSNGTMTLTQTSGPTATITGPSSGVFTITHPSEALAADMVFDLVATSGTTDTKTITIPRPGGGRSFKVYTGSAWL